MKDSVVLCGNKRPKRLKKLAYIHLQSFDFPLVSPTTGSTLDSIRLEPDRTYTVGRAKGNCDFVFKCRLVSKQHCQILFDCEERKIYIIDGAFLLRSVGGSGREIKSNCVRGFRRRFVCNGESGESVECSTSSVRVSLNGVFVNGVKVKSGMVRELCAGDEVLLGCSNEGACGFQARIGFVVKGVVFKEEVVAGPEQALLGGNRLFESATSVGHSQGSVSSGKRNKRVFAFPASEDMNPMYDHSRLKCGELFGRAQFLLGQCRDILGSDDPVLHIQQFNASDFRMENPHSFKNKLVYSSHVTTLGDGKCALVDEADPYNGEPVRDEARACQTDKVVTDSVWVGRDHLLQKDNTDNSDNVVSDNIHKNLSMISVCEENASCIGGSEKIKAGKYCCPPPGKKFYLNRLQSMDSRCCHHDVISLPELLHPVENILRIFIATFTTEISWFLSYCEIPSHLPVTIACHSTERCWSSSIDKRTSVPYANFPNLMLVFPPFPEAIAFGKDRKRQGIACHHPKLLVLQREEHIRVIITSANLVSNQWNNVTNTVWWQDFPRRSAPNFSSLFAQLADGQINKDSKSDFAAQLAGFMASLMIDVPSQAHWIIELTKYNFEMATGYLIASVPGIHSRVGSSSAPILHLQLLSQAEQHKLPFEDVKLLGSVEASVVGLSHLFQNAVDRNGAQLKRLAAFLSKSCKNAYGLLEVVLKRNKNMPVDANALSILVPNPDQSGDCIQLGFLPRYVAKWVSPLWDSGFFRFSGYIYPKEACAAALGESNTKVQLILYVSQGPLFSDMIGLMDSEHVAFCSLIASIKRYSGLWRLQEVLGQYKWPELEESDFFYGASSIGSLVNAQFLAAFSAAAGKRSPRLFDSEESDPEWGCWSASQELRNPSIRIIFPTIERVKNSRNGILSSRRILCFSEKTWQRLKTVDILHDAVPYPHERVGHPSHVKVAGRLFRSKTKASSFGWVYCGSHNFSAAAWGRPMSHPFGVNSNQQRMTGSSLGSRLHICNYELGIVFIFPPAATSGFSNDDNNTNIDGIVLPFAVPPPKYEHTDRPATMRAMREALAELAEQERPELVELATTEEMTEEIPDEEEAADSPDYVVEEQEEEKAYAEMLWVQVDSTES